MAAGVHMSLSAKQNDDENENDECFKISIILLNKRKFIRHVFTQIFSCLCESKSSISCCNLKMVKQIFPDRSHRGWIQHIVHQNAALHHLIVTFIEQHKQNTQSTAS